MLLGAWKHRYISMSVFLCAQGVVQVCAPSLPLIHQSCAQAQESAEKPLLFKGILLVSKIERSNSPFLILVQELQLI